MIPLQLNMLHPLDSIGAINVSLQFLLVGIHGNPSVLATTLEQ